MRNMKMNTLLPINPYICNIFVDSCAFDPDDDIEAKASQALFNNERLNIIIAHSNIKEIEHPKTPAWVKQEALSRIFTMETSLTPQELAIKQKIHKILTGNGKPEKMIKDAEHVFESHKYGSYFVTNDNRILKKREEIFNISNARIVRPTELLHSLENEYA